MNAVLQKILQNKIIKWEAIWFQETWLRIFKKQKKNEKWLWQKDKPLENINASPMNPGDELLGTFFILWDPWNYYSLLSWFFQTTHTHFNNQIIAELISHFIMKSKRSINHSSFFFLWSFGFSYYSYYYIFKVFLKFENIMWLHWF